MLRKFFWKILPLNLKKQLDNFIILSKGYGQYKSIKNNNAIDKNGKEIPWYTYPAIEYLNHLNLSDKDVFEWGSGNSSFYWSKKTNKVISIEADKMWYEKVLKNKQNNQEVIFAEDKNKYINSISNFDKKFDIIIIDDRYRDECINNALKYLKDDGFVILDNSDWFPLAVKRLRDYNLFQVDFHGFGPINNYTWTTSLFFCRNFKQNYSRDLESIANIK